MTAPRHCFVAPHRLSLWKQSACLVGGTVAAVASLFPVPSARAAAETWTGATDNTWATGTNWSGTNLPPISGDTLVFTSATGVGGLLLNNNLTDANFNVGTGAANTAAITFNAGAGAYVIGDGTGAANAGNPFALAGGIANASTSTQTINNPLSVAAVSTVGLIAGGGNVVLTGNVSGVGSFTANGAGVLTLSGNNTYTGVTGLNTGATINLNSATAIGTGTLSVNGNATIDNTSGAAIVLTNANTLSLIGGSLTFTGTAAGTSHDLTFGTASFTSSNRTITVTGAGSTLTVGSLTDGGNARQLTKTGAGTLTLSGAAGTFTGGTVLANGTLSVGNDAALGTGNLTITAAGTPILQAVGGARTLSNPLILNTGSTIAGANNLTFTGPVTNNATGTSAMTINNTGLTTFAGPFSIRGGTTQAQRVLTIQGSGNLLVSGGITSGINDGTTSTANFSSFSYLGTGTVRVTGNNTYNGQTAVGSATVTTGTLLINGSHTGTASANAIATTYSVFGTLGGTGTINTNTTGDRTVTINAGGTLAPGDSTLAPAAQTGILTLVAPLTFATGSTFAVQLGGNTAGQGAGHYDQANVTGAVTINTGVNLTLSTVNNYVPAGSDILYILARDGTTATTAFANAAEGSTVTVAGGYTGQITYLANWNGSEANSTLTGGNDVAIYNLVVPEPSTWATTCLLLGATGGWYFRRRRLAGWTA